MFHFAKIAGRITRFALYPPHTTLLQLHCSLLCFFYFYSFVKPFMYYFERLEAAPLYFELFVFFM